VRLAGEEILGLPPNAVTQRGVGYVPQGRRLWPSLSVDEHVRLVSCRGGPWTADRIYRTFPRLADRRSNRAADLSGGEQQMLTIARALLLNPVLLVMDEPTEGLAPVIVKQVADMLKQLAADGAISVLLVEQNLGVAIEVADTVAVMVNGRIARSMPAAELAADRELQQRLLGVRIGDDEDAIDAESGPTEDGAVEVITVRRAGDESPAARAAYVAGTFDTKGRELFFLRNCLEKLGIHTVTVDLSTSGKPSSANVHPREVARHHPRGESVVFTGDRGTAVIQMAVAFESFIARRPDVGGLISAGGSAGTALATPAMRRLPLGVPKVMVSSVASGDVKPDVGPADICLMYSVADVSGINPISEKVLTNAAHALAGMIAYARPAGDGAESPLAPSVRDHVIAPHPVQIIPETETRSGLGIDRTD
jgi:ABC-type branched-subunit amino acid transport system ATPase component